MDITPLQIQKKEFSKVFRGYNKEEVDEFLDKVSFDYEKIYKDNKDLKEELENIKEQIKSYKELEVTLKNTLVMAEKTAEDVKNNALRDRNSILKEAMLRAQDILSQAERKYDSTKEQLEELRRQFYLYKTRFRNFVQSQIDFLDSFELDIFDDEEEKFESFFEAAAGEDLEADDSVEEVFDTDLPQTLETDDYENPIDEENDTEENEVEQQ